MGRCKFIKFMDDNLGECRLGLLREFIAKGNLDMALKEIENTRIKFNDYNLALSKLENGLQQELVDEPVDCGCGGDCDGAGIIRFRPVGSVSAVMNLTPEERFDPGLDSPNAILKDLPFKPVDDDCEE